MPLNIPASNQKRIVIVGAGFAGITLARKLQSADYQIVLIDRNNFHQFQPLFYQVAMAGLEPSSIVFPLRKAFQKVKNVFIRVAEVVSVELTEKKLITSEGDLVFDYLVVATGANTNYYGNEQIKANTIPLKSVSEALYLRNCIFEDYERAVLADTHANRQKYLDIVIVGGGPTGVEVAGALAEMKKYIVPKDYQDLNGDEIEIHLVHGGERLLNTMSEEAGKAAEKFLTGLGVKLWMDRVVKSFDGETVLIDDGSEIRCKKVIWAAGIVGCPIAGLPPEALVKGNRIKVNAINALESHPEVFILGDLAYQTSDEHYPNGHPQVAQVALQQAKNLAENLRTKGETIGSRPFHYKDPGSMATVGRNKAVVDLKNWKTQGFLAWGMWLFVHLFYLLGGKNKLFVFLNWLWNYFTYDQSLRLVIKPFRRDLK